MGTHSDGYVEQELLTTFVTCEGDLSDPQFNTKFARLLKQLQKLLLKDPGQYLGVVKVEPWNSVRVTFTVPKEAALRLRQLAQQGDATLSQLGILSVQLEGDQAISLRIAGRVGGESREIVLRTTPADGDGISGESSVASDAVVDHLISKNAVVSTSGGTASLFRTMTHVLSGGTVTQPMAAAFKSPNMVSSQVMNTNSIAGFSISPKVSNATIITTAKNSLPHSYHSPFVTTNVSAAAAGALSVQNRETTSNVADSSGVAASGSGGGNSHRFSLPPPPYPNAKTSTSAHMMKSNRNAPDDASTMNNPSPVNVALSSPLLVNLLQNDGVPINNSKIAVSDKHRLKQPPPPHIKNAVPSSTVKRKESALDAPIQTSSGTSDSANSATEMQVIQRIQRAPMSTENLTMVTNVRIPVESCNSEIVTVTSGKLPTMNHLTTVTANVKQTYNTSQSPVVNMFQRQNVTAGAGPLTNQTKTAVQSSTLINNQLANRITYSSHNDNQLLAVGQAPKFGVRVINVQQQPSQQQPATQTSQQQLFQAQQQQQLLQKQLVQQQMLQSQSQFQNQQQQQQQQQQQLIMQSQQQQTQQHFIQQQKSVILQQNLQGAKVNVSSVQELARFNVGSVSGGRIINQSSDALSSQITNETKFDALFNDNSSLADGQLSTMSDQESKTMNYMPVSNISADASSQGSKLEANTLQNNAIVTCTSLQFVKSFTFTNPSLSQNTMVSNSVSMAGSVQQNAKLNVTPKINSVVYTSMPNAIVTQDNKLSNTSTVTTVYNASNSYHNAVVTNSNANTVSGDNQYGTEIKQVGDLYSKSDLGVTTTMTTTNALQKIFQTAPAYSSSSNANLNQHTTSTTQLPQYSRTTSNVYTPSIDEKSNSSNGDKNVPTSQPPPPYTSTSSSEKEPQFLINPLTGEMEAMPNESSDNESDNQTDIFNSLPPSVANNEDSCFSFSPPVTNEKSNSMYSDDDDDDHSSQSTRKGDTDSDLESLSGKPFSETNFARHRVLSAGSSPNPSTGEKIKIRLKLEKNEPVSSAYKVDVLNTNMKKVDKPTSIVKPMPRVHSGSVPSATNAQNSVTNATVDEPRVPPIRLSLRGLAFVKKNKKWSDESKDSSDDAIDNKKYFNKNKLSPNEVMSEKECLSDTIDLCKSPAKICKNVDITEDADELKVKVTKSKKSSDSDDMSVTSQSENSNEVSSPYNMILPSVRTFPTEAEVTSILRSVPTDAPNKMSLSCVKIKKKEGKKKLFPRDRTSMLSGSVLGDDSTDTFTRVINETKCTLSSQSRGKSKSNSSSLLKSVMKSTAAKEARLMNLANRRPNTGSTASNPTVNEAGPVIITSKGGSVPTSLQQRRASADMTYPVSGTTFSNVKTPQRSSADTFTHTSSQFVPSPHSTNNIYTTAATAVAVAAAAAAATHNNSKEGKKFVNNAVVSGGASGCGTATKKVANNCKQTRDYQNLKTALVNHENKKAVATMVANSAAAHFIKKNPIEVECSKQNVVVNCLQVESNPSACGLPNLPTTHLDLSEKVMKQRLLEDVTSFGEPTRKKQRLDSGEANLKNGPILDNRLITLPGSKESGEVTMGVGGESPSGATSEHTSNQGEDSGIESMDALSEKSPNQGESPCRKEEKDNNGCSDNGNANNREKKSIAYCDKPNVDSFSDSCSSNSSQCDRGREHEKEADSDNKISTLALTNCLESSNENVTSKDKEEKTYERDETMSPDLDDVQPFRVTPALYTYSNPEKIRVDSPSPVLEDITDDISLSPKPIVVEQPKTSARLKRKRKEVSDPIFVANEKNKSNAGGKSLLEQLLIDIPSDGNVEIRRTGMSTRNTRSQLKGLSQPSPDTLSMCSTSSSSSIKTPKCSPVPRADDTPNKSSPRPSSRLTSRRSRKGSESSNVSNGEDSVTYGRSGKRRCSENTVEVKGCLGFEDQNGKKVAISGNASIEAFRSISENSVTATPTVVVSSTKAGVTRGSSNAANRRINNVASCDNVTQSNTTRPVGKKRKGIGDASVTRKSNFNKTHDNDVPLVQVAAGAEQEEQISEQSVNVSSTTPRTNSRLASMNSAATSKQTSTPSTSRRSVRQNHVTRRRKSPATVDKMNTSTSNSLINANNAASNNNNNTNKNNNNTKPSAANAGETCKNVNEKNGVGVNTEKIESKSISKLNCVTKKEIVSQITTTNSTNSIIDTKTNNGTNFTPNATTTTTVTTRGNSVKQTHLINDSAIAAPPQDISHTHTVPVSEEVINTRRKTRSVANSNVSDELTNKRRRNSRDGK